MTAIRREVFDLSEQVVSKFAEKQEKAKKLADTKASGPSDVADRLETELGEFTERLLNQHRARAKMEEELEHVEKAVAIMKSVRAHAKLAKLEL